uniref:Uncharacterized protein n=1 Tax=Arundo donax TaxID=35708 RepID=A0A0A8ZYY3_ARUDO
MKTKGTKRRFTRMCHKFIHQHFQEQLHYTLK